MIEVAYLIREACTTRGIIPSNFPRIGSATQRPMSVSSAAASSRDEECDCSCPIRTKPPPLPNALPFPATDANRATLQNWIQDRYRSSTFNTCKCQTFPLMEGPPLELHVDPEAKPIAVHKPIPVPLHWQQEVKASIDRDVKLWVLEAVKVGEPVTWCHRMVMARTKNGKPRRKVDMQVLNKHAVRETHHTQSLFHQATLVPSGTKKTISDAWNGCIVCQSEKKIATSPLGRYRYKSCPQGYAASQDRYTRRFDEIFNDFPNKTKCIDDTCLWAVTLEESFFQTCHWLDICGPHGIVQNSEIFVFGSDAVEFAGIVITPTKIQPSDKHIRAIRDFPTPQNITNIRSWFGLINQVWYCDYLRNDMAPFREHLKPSTMFNWDDQLHHVFEQSKSAILSKISEGVWIFDPNVSHVSPQIGPRKASVSGSCRNTAPVRSSLLAVAQRDGK